MRASGRTFEHQAREALAGSFLAAFPDGARDRLLADAVRLDLPAGSIVYRETDQPRAGLVVAGLLRVYVASPEGRQVTVRYARSGDVLGVAVTVGGPVPVGVQALTDSTLLLLNVHSIEELGKADPRVAWAIAEELARRLYDTLDELAGNVFGSVRQRVIRHLLDLAAERQRGQALVVSVSQQEIADAVGSVREVVARTLRDLRAEGLVGMSPDGIRLIDPAGLHAESWHRGEA
jgi:CRP/FNR family transcriptional regulator